MTSSQEMTEDLLKKAEEYSEEYNIHLNSTRKEGMNEKENLRNEGITQEKEMLQKTYSSVEEKLANARQEIFRMVEEAKKNLQSEIDLFSHELAKKVLGRSI